MSSGIEQSGSSGAGRDPVTWRRHQRLALDALARRHASATERGESSRSWVVLPPGAGKTWVGLGVAAAALGRGEVERVVVLAPNTAIQTQWISAAAEFGIDAGSSRGLGTALTALTYQSVAVFERPDAVGEPTDDIGRAEATDPDEMPDLPEEVDEPQDVLARLHPNGAALVDRFASGGPLLLVLDECHHLIDLWGALLVALLDRVPHARVLGLTATPRETLTGPQEQRVADLFGEVAYAASVPAVVREGDLAPFLELAWFVRPTAAERGWLAQSAERFAELTALLEDPTFGTTPFLAWVRQRFLDPPPGGPAPSWSARSLSEPELTGAVLRMAHSGRVPMPEEAHLREEHARDPSVEDWMALLGDWLLRCVQPSEDPRDATVIEVVRRTLPAVDRVWTRNGVRRGRSVVDRVLARSDAKADACAEILHHASNDLGSRLRALVLCDHERASATLPMSLDGVVEAAAGSAWVLLDRIAADPTTAALRPVLVTGATVAGAPEVMADLAAFVAERDRDLAATLTVQTVPPDAPEVGSVPLARLVGTGAWRSRRWVPDVTRFFEAGHSQVLVGTKGLLGEGWNARRVTGVIDLTSSTTSQSVVQVRGRSLRTDPDWPDKVAVNWTVACLAPEHPQGDADFFRLVRKHDGFFGVDDAGAVVDGVGHLDATLSPFRPPQVDEIDTLNARSLTRASALDAVAQRWRVGEAYDDRAGIALRVRVRASRRAPAPASGVAEPVIAVTPARPPEMPAVARIDPTLIRSAPSRPVTSAFALLTAALATVGLVAGSGEARYVLAPVLAAVPALIYLALWRHARQTADARRAEIVAARRAHAEALCAHARRLPEPQHVAGALADALHAVGDSPVAAEAVEVSLDDDGTYRCRLRGVEEATAAIFAEALDEALGPIEAPRYLVSRPVLSEGDGLAGRDVEAILGQAEAGVLPGDAEAWHPVPSVLGTHRRRADAYALAWARWLRGERTPVGTRSAQGAGILAAQHGADPFAVTSVMRRHWG